MGIICILVLGSALGYNILQGTPNFGPPAPPYTNDYHHVDMVAPFKDTNYVTQVKHNVEIPAIRYP